MYIKFQESSWNIKIRSPARAVTDWVYCPEVAASPWPAAVGWQPLLGSKSTQLLHGRDFLILFHHFNDIISIDSKEYRRNSFVYFLRSQLVRMAVLICSTDVRAVQTLDFINRCSNENK